MPEYLGGEIESVAQSGAPPYEFAEALMRRLAEPGLAIMVIEDAHLADEATLDVLRIVARRIDLLPALIVVTFRDDELDRRHPLRVLLGELALGNRAVRIQVEPLSYSAVAALGEPHGVDVHELTERRTATLSSSPRSSRRATPRFPTPCGTQSSHAYPGCPRAPRKCSKPSRLSRPTASSGCWRLSYLIQLRRSRTAWQPGCCAPSPTGCVSGTSSHAELSRTPSPAPVASRSTVAQSLHSPSGRLWISRGSYTTPTRSPTRSGASLRTPAAERAALVGAHREAADNCARVLRFRSLIPRAEQLELLERRAHECYLTDDNSEALAAMQAALEGYRDLGDVLGEARCLRRLSEMLWCPGRVSEAEEAGRLSMYLLERSGPGTKELGLAYANCRSWGARRPTARRRGHGAGA